MTYSRLLQVPEDDREYMTLEELKPLNGAGVVVVNGDGQLHQQQQQHHHGSYQPSYYQLSAMVEHPCAPSAYQNSQNMDSSNSNMTDLQSTDCSMSAMTSNRKRKSSFQEASDLEEDPADDVKSMKTSDENKKQNHSEIEKRRRDKMNTYITELSSIVPMCHAMSRKLDKLTVLRMAVQHLKTIRGAVHSYTEGHYKPSFLSDQELKHLILQVADGFLFVVGCDRGRILYVSESVSKVLAFSQGDLLGQSLFDILHPKDVAKVKEQLSSSDLNPRERLIDAKTMLPVKTDIPQGASRLCPGARRSFFCRMKCKANAQVKEEADTTTGCIGRKSKQSSDKKYNVIHCTGYLKSWAPAKIGVEEQEIEGDSSCNLSCLVAIGRILPHISTLVAATQSKPTMSSIEFVSRHALDGKFLFVDQRATLVLGFLPQELLGTSMYEYYHNDDVNSIAEFHKAALKNNERVTTDIYRFRTRDGGFIRLQSEWKGFKNPWTKEVEYMIAKNNLVMMDFRNVESSGSRAEDIDNNFDFFAQTNGKDMQNYINSQIEASKIGRQIAEQVLDSQRRVIESSSGSSPDPEQEAALPMQGAELHISPNIVIASTDNLRPTNNAPTPIINGYTTPDSHYNHVQNNITITNITNDPGGVSPSIVPASEEQMMGIMEDAVREAPRNAPTEGNDEAAMAVIMSLLEADAGLGGPVDFSGLPWPLP